MATPVSESQIDLSWSGSTDPEIGISSYNIYRDGVAVGSTSGLSFSDTGQSENTSYTYEVSAVNGAAPPPFRSRLTWIPTPMTFPSGEHSFNPRCRSTTW